MAGPPLLAGISRVQSPALMHMFYKFYRLSMLPGPSAAPFGFMFCQGKKHHVSDTGSVIFQVAVLLLVDTSASSYVLVC
jgi:hypothetical protein